MRRAALSRKRLKVSIFPVATGYADYLKRKIRDAHRMLGSALQEISIALVDGRTMSKAHKRYLGVSGPTDVLTFPLEFDSRGGITAGEIVICVPVARRKSREMGTLFKNELLLYALHGMLHLSGFDDRTAAQYHRMHQMEDTILRRLGAGAVFDPKERK